jgi:hypothetical protein
VPPALVPGLPAQVGLSAVASSGPLRSVLSFVVVLGLALAVLRLRGPTVDRAVDRTADGSPVAVVYGVVAFGLVAVVGSYGLSQAARAGVGTQVLQSVGGLVVGAALATLGAFGYLVLGVYLTDVEGGRRPLLGALTGAVLSALPWLVLPTLPALGLWVLLAAVGLGAPTRRYIHGERTVATETR